ncbi:rRNA-processing protein [Halocaridina rubra]|uniref:rRNA-processing protein n=1 Tax=Halocaridina rubra TaxID=373956 RepID=A0AAN9AAC3_HALRR
MEEEDKASVDFITCAAWVRRGIAKADPEKVEISKEDLERIIKETGGDIKELEELEAEVVKGLKKSKGEEDAEEMDVEEEEEADGDGEDEAGEERKHVSRKNDDCLSFESRYGMEKYEDEEDEGMEKLLQLGQMALYASSEDDPFITVKDESDNDSEPENHAILPSDNLIAVGHVEGDAAILEVYVYNSDQNCLYVHHDMLLPAVPLCMEWLNYDPCDEELKPANLIAVGSMSPVIEVWDLDLVDCMEPAYRLGKRGKKKKKIPGVGHKDAVLSLAWNRNAEHVLASGSVDQTVILWDLQHGSVAQQLTSFDEKVQSLQWHQKEPHTILTGSCDKMVRLFDCNSSDSFKSCKLDGEVECVIWNTLSDKSHECLACTDQGTVFAIDCRQEKPLWSIKAHSEGCTGIQLSPECPGCLITVSSDKSVKVWDVKSETPSLILEKNPRIGIINCLASCPDLPFVFCLGGDNREDNFKVWDVRSSLKVRSTFCPRVGLPVDDEVEDEDDEESMSLNNQYTVGNRRHPSQKSAGMLNEKERSNIESNNLGTNRNRHPPKKREFTQFRDADSTSVGATGFGGGGSSERKPQRIVFNDHSESTAGSSSGAKPKKFKKKKGGHIDTKKSKC